MAQHGYDITGLLVLLWVACVGAEYVTWIVRRNGK